MAWIGEHDDRIDGKQWKNKDKSSIAHKIGNSDNDPWIKDNQIDMLYANWNDETQNNWCHSFLALYGRYRRHQITGYSRVKPVYWRNFSWKAFKEKVFCLQKENLQSITEDYF